MAESVLSNANGVNQRRERPIRVLRRGPVDLIDVDAPKAPMWSREDVQRVLYHVVRQYEIAQELGGDSELLRDAIRIGRETLKDNNWWPNDD